MRRRLAILGIVLLGIGGVSAIGLWWALGPGASQQISTTDLPSLPELPAPPSPPAPEPASPDPEDSRPAESSAALKVGVLDQGKLTVEGRGQPFATEEYSLKRLESGEIVLESRGTLTFKIAFINAQATFMQVMRFNSEKRPLSYQLALHGPVGIGNRKVSALFRATEGVLHDGEKESTIQLPKEPFLLLGMFSSYTLLTLWAEPAEPLTLKVITLRGERGAGAPPTPEVTLERLGIVRLQGPESTSTEAEEYLLQSERFSLKFYRDGERFLGMRSVATEKDPEGIFFIYRSDLFPKGFTVLQAP
ncbi:MAG: hypothetical protein NZ610_07500 [Candidatus Bipolaricaulota bacterium]|nr:hypothetical protein [Candidatus Bipolaricaulota bacterium]MCS7275223.1 hypothetical protein [Candidatus Bipolaricaulota bacterium]MDW8110308.1 hypothetical protein [Candidatus Bipolaricaulota bacterium]